MTVRFFYIFLHLPLKKRRTILLYKLRNFCYFCEVFRQNAFRTLILMFFVICINVGMDGKDTYRVFVIQKMYNYFSTIDTLQEGYKTTSYLNYQIKTDKKNITLLGVPSMYTFYNEDRNEFVGEALLQFTFHTKGENEAHVIARSSTIRHHRRMIPNLYDYLSPNIYSTTLISDQLLSPFNRRNRHFYKYEVKKLDESRARLEIRRKAPNTQAVRGHAIIDTSTGRIVSCLLSCEYDMVAIEASFDLGENGIQSLYPMHSHIKAKFTFMGNRMRAIYDTTYGLPLLSDSITFQSDEEERAFLERHRPYSLNAFQEGLYEEYDSLNRPAETPISDTLIVSEKKPFHRKLWNFISDNVIHHINGRFGHESQGYYRLSPPLNPFYLSYSGRRGLHYRTKLRWGYEFTSNREINSVVKIGYSFKQKQLLINIPVVFYFDKKNNGYVKYHFINGERVTNTTVLEKLKEEHTDSINWDAMDLDYFKHSESIFMLHYDFNPYWGVESGIINNQWSAIIDKNFETLDKPTRYHATSWVGILTLRPWGWKGPILTFNYERTFKSLSKKSMNFEKWEIDCSYLKRLPSLRSLSIRAGAGLYTSNMEKNYFLEFNNFSNNYIPGGWNDDWSGEFELLHDNWYNSSKYYIRSNMTYESPMLLLSWIPYVGNVIEKERLYFSVLNLSHLSHYCELGYGITNRVFSMGVFAGLKRGAYQSIGIKFGFELFEKW